MTVQDSAPEIVGNFGKALGCAAVTQFLYISGVPNRDKHGLLCLLNMAQGPSVSSIKTRSRELRISRTLHFANLGDLICNEKSNGEKMRSSRAPHFPLVKTRCPILPK